MWHGVIRGGKVTLTVSAAGITSPSTPVTLFIYGDSSSPGQSTLRSYFSAQQPPSYWPSGTTYQYADVLMDIAYVESAHTYSQFNARGQLQGQPLYEGLR